MASRHSLKTSIEWLGLEANEKDARAGARGGRCDQLLRRRPATSCRDRLLASAHTEGALSGH